MLLVPYNTTISLGAGFNSYAQQLCINDAVEAESPGSSGDKDSQPVSQLSNASAGKTVTWTTKFVESVSDVTSAMSVSAAATIKENGNLDEATGAFVSLDHIEGSHVAYLVQVKVVCQLLESKNLTRMRNIPGTNASNFTEIYGDSFISGFIEGGEFAALFCVTVATEEHIVAVRSALEAEFHALEEGKPTASPQDFQRLVDDGSASVNISVAWIGDTTQDPADFDWTIESVRDAAIDFPDMVVQCPQRTHAIVTKYPALESYRELTRHMTPLTYANVESYTSKLLDDYFKYKHIWAFIETQSKSQSDYSPTLQSRVETPGSTSYGVVAHDKYDVTSAVETRGENTNIKVYPSTLIGFQQARRDCRIQMSKIVNEVDLILLNPDIVTKEREPQYLSPKLFKEKISQ